MVDLWGGVADPKTNKPWARDTVSIVFSCTKGVVAIATMGAVEQGLVDLDAPVAKYWPEFAAAGKGDISVRWLLTHQAGLSALQPPLTLQDVADLVRMSVELAAQPNLDAWDETRLSRRHARLV